MPSTSGPGPGRTPPDDRPSADRRTVLSTRRLESYTDGVFAIAATLLVLNLSVDGFRAVRTDADFLNQLVSVAPSLLNVVISFLLLSVLWLVHVRQFEFIPRVDTTIIWLNNFRLLGVVLVPFSTSLNDEYSDFLLGRTLLPLNFVLIVAFSTWQWFHASSPRRHLVHGASAEAVHNGRVNSISALALAVGVVPLATLIGSAAFALFALDPVIARVLRRLGVLRATPDGVVAG
ncbi:DUF1211 domain-containing protein [Cryobacterium sp. 1639]|uniref:TMEM175 family protein n=1 Tax=Cryobacterium inferilacus TaxID=2866629 RepID=UPI001C72B1E6|nr:TMEM175 family protein [Cryobacterium sp. 1639]MBX0298517.1 DUF1211 domain-containing protein [Cryobacterium sp. 1639]